MKRGAAPEDFARLAIAVRALYAAAPNDFARLDTADSALRLAAPFEYLQFEYTALAQAVVEALQAVAPGEWGVYLNSVSGTAAQNQAQAVLAEAAPREYAALGIIINALEDLQPASNP